MKKIVVYNPIGIVNTIPIPPASALANSKDRFMFSVKPNGDAFLKYSINNGIEPLIYAKNKIFVIVPIISRPISNPDFTSALTGMLLFFSYKLKREEDIVMAISITAPSEPINNPAIKTVLYGLVINCNSS